MDIQTVLISLGASIFTVLGGKVWDVYWSKKANDEELHYLAIRLAYLFEGYASECVKSITEDEHFEISHSVIGEPISEIPSFPDLPESVAYKKLKHQLLWQVYNFPQKIKDFESFINSRRFLEQDEVKDMLIRDVINLGVHAISLSEQLRVQYQLVVANPIIDIKSHTNLYTNYQQLLNLKQRHKISED